MEAERQWGPSSVGQQGLRSLVPDCTFLGIPITFPLPHMLGTVQNVSYIFNFMASFRPIFRQESGNGS